MAVQGFQHVSAPLRLFSGPDCLEKLGGELDRAGGRRALVVCGGSLMREGAALDLVRSALGQLYAGSFAGVKGHSPIEAVEAGAAEMARCGADALVAVGGGSAMVTARAMNILASEKADLRVLSTSRDASGAMRSPKLLAPKLPQINIPTTPNTAVVKAGTAVQDHETGIRHAMFDPKTRARAVFVHPALLATAPRPLVLSAALDALMSGIEGLTSSKSRDLLAEGSLMQAVRLLARAAEPGAADEEGDARTRLALGAILAGDGTDFTGAGLATALGHAIGVSAGVENSLAKAIVLPGVLRFNGEHATAGLGNVAAALGLPDAPGGASAAAVEAITRIVRALGAPARLRDIGLPADRLPAIAAKTMGDWFLRGNVRPVKDVSEVLGVLEAAY